MWHVACHMPGVGFEPTRHEGQSGLSRSRLPFRHPGLVREPYRRPFRHPGLVREPYRRPFRHPRLVREPYRRPFRHPGLVREPYRRPFRHPGLVREPYRRLAGRGLDAIAVPEAPTQRGSQVGVGDVATLRCLATFPRLRS
jgi:hypothetical protein